MTALERHLAQLEPRRTDRTLESYETVLACVQCKTTVALFEASHGATSEEEHRFTDPDTFVCSRCLESDNTQSQEEK